MRLDLHVHSSYSSDSLNSLRIIVRKCRKLNIIPAITDHNNINAHKQLRKMNFEFIPGEEISTKEGHLIGLYLTESIKGDISFIEAIDLIKQQGGLTYLPHMYDINRYGVGKEALAKRADIIEIFNPKCAFDEYNEKARRFAKRNKKFAGAGSDSHIFFEIGFTYVEIQETDISQPKALLKALKKGKIIGKKPFFTSMGFGRPIQFIKEMSKLFFRGAKP